jgi:hypothetical protein
MDIFIHFSEIEKIKYLPLTKLRLGAVLIDFDISNKEIILEFFRLISNNNLTIVSICGINSEVTHDYVDTILLENELDNTITTWHETGNNINSFAEAMGILHSFEVDNVIFLYRYEKPYADS